MLVGIAGRCGGSAGLHRLFHFVVLGCAVVGWVVRSWRRGVWPVPVVVAKSARQALAQGQWAGRWSMSRCPVVAIRAGMVHIAICARPTRPIPGPEPRVVPTFHMCKTRPGRVLSHVPGLRCSHGRTNAPDRRTPLRSGQPCTPVTASIHPRLTLTRRYDDSLALTLAVFPSPTPTDGSQNASASSLSFTPRRHQRRMSERGQAYEH